MPQHLDQPSDQVYDPNIETTALKDRRLEAQTWQVVDDYIKDHLIDGPDEPGCGQAPGTACSLTVQPSVASPWQTRRS